MSAPLNSDKIDEQRILSLWKDITFPGSFRGIKTFQALLKLDKNIDISEKDLLRILKKEPFYLIHQLKPTRFKTRPYITHNYGELIQADIAYMFSDTPDQFKYFLLVIDVFSAKLFVEVLKNKDAKSVSNALENIFKRFGAPIFEIQTDKGTEFKNSYTNKLFKKLSIIHRTKRGLRKASLVESGIFRVKRKLYVFLRSHLKRNWSDYINLVVDSLNAIPLKKLGYLKPNQITNESSSIEVDKNLLANNLAIPKEPTYSEQKQNQVAYEKSANENLLRVGDYVYLRQYEPKFGKSFDIQEHFLQHVSFWKYLLSKAQKTYSFSLMLCQLVQKFSVKHQ